MLIHWRTVGRALVCGALCGTFFSAVAVSSSDFAVRVSATVETNPARINLSWPADSSALYCALSRKSRDDTLWSAEIELAVDATNYTDSNVLSGSAYEYRIYRITPSYDSYGYVYTGIEVPLVESRGKIILLVDNTMAASLTMELTCFQQDLVGDGWTVLRHDVPRMSIDPANSSSSVWTARSNELASVKALISDDYNTDLGNVKALFILGRVPVPYSGDLYPDGHPDHRGAWPADVFYADVGSSWTDFSLTSTGASDLRNRNVPGDGKFDQTQIASDLELQVGRVDFANMPAFPVGEPELIRRYLNKDHAFRHRMFTATRRGLIDDHLGLSTGEAFAANGWRDFAAFFGAANTVAGDWLTTLSTQSYLWGYGCGGGSYTTCSGVATTPQLATNDPRVVFTMFFGSYFGDWDSQNNLLRAAIATPSYTLTSAWVGRPFWFFHHMALGETIGFSTRLTQNESGALYSGSGHRRFADIALMGDPTLRMHVVAPPSALGIKTNGSGGVELNWNASPDTVLGYHVYRAPTAAGPFTRLNGSLLTSTSYTDPVVTTNVYMVRAVKLEVSGSGSYYNASQGIFQDLAGNFGPPELKISSVSGGVGLSWATNSPGYHLEATDSLLSVNWLGVTNPVQTINGLNTVVVDPSRSNQFFRLRYP